MSRGEPATRGADIIHRSFEEFHESFRAITRRSIDRFERRDWDGIRRDTVRRLGLHPRCVEESLTALREEFGARIEQKTFWTAVKDAYTMAILGTDDFELAQTFFNSLTRRVFSHVGVDPDIDFLARDVPLPFSGWEMASARMYAVERVDAPLMHKILEHASFRTPFKNLGESAEAAADAIRRRLKEVFRDERIEAIDVLRPPLIRNKAAYLIGRARRQGRFAAFLLPILHEEDGLVLDGVVLEENEISIIFSFARWYFHADLANPRQAIGFLHSLLPRKRISELYISLGYNRHGKTEFFSDLTNYIEHTQEKFVVAPGVPGLVMSVFTLPSYEFVFKVIRDHFPVSKQTSRRKIKERYRQVHVHDRVGRLVDFQEFEHLQFPRRRFAAEILEELLETASRSVSIEEDQVVLGHLYVGRRVVPLNLYLERESDENCERAVLDWGNALKELAAANMFAGDMLIKNFGVTRHGRVVFYDYDELCPLTDCNFRRFPEPRDEDQAYSAEPHFTVRDGDIFPSELQTFLGLTGRLREIFEEAHSEIFEVEFWQRTQERNREGELIDFFPYSDARREAEDQGDRGQQAD
jgi:isocitrate dehydrogenase kinase/phosphatase